MKSGLRPILLLVVVSCWGCSAEQDATTAASVEPDVHEPADPNVVARAAVVLDSCLTLEGPGGVAGEVYYKSGANIGYTCLAETTHGCRALEPCTGYYMEVSNACSDESFDCADDVLTGCYPGFFLRVDCARIGGMCVESGQCVSSKSERCDQESFPHLRRRQAGSM